MLDELPKDYRGPDRRQASARVARVQRQVFSPSLDEAERLVIIWGKSLL